MAKSVLDTIESEPQKKGKSDIQTIPVKGTTVSRYAQACDDKKQAEKTMKELVPLLQEAGVEFVFTQNAAREGRPQEMISSVNLVDKASASAAEGTVDRVQFSWTRRDLKSDPKQVKSFFGMIRTTKGRTVEW